MAKHSSSYSTRSKIVLSLCVVLALTATTTFAYWTSQTTMNSGPIDAGQVSISVDNNVSTYNNTSVAINDIYPGEEQAYTVVVSNIGDSPYNYDVSVQQGATWTYGGNYLTAQYWGPITQTPTALNSTTGNQAIPSRSGACNAANTRSITKLTTNPVTITSSATNLFSGGKRTLAVGATDSLCFVVGMISSVPSDQQGKSATVQFNFNADQKYP